LTATERYIHALTELRPGELGLLRTHAGQSLDESVDGFDLFTGLWWPLRQKNQRAPRREVAWLIAKVYACCPIQHSAADSFACQLRRCRPNEEQARSRFQRKFDELLTLPLGRIETSLRWALDSIVSGKLGVDWAGLADDLSVWERESTRLKWADEFLKSSKEDSHVN
jgi:CRISPR type I-E-associated protein CasB/Cse2